MRTKLLAATLLLTVVVGSLAFGGGASDYKTAKVKSCCGSCQK